MMKTSLGLKVGAPSGFTVKRDFLSHNQTQIETICVGRRIQKKNTLQTSHTTALKSFWTRPSFNGGWRAFGWLAASDAFLLSKTCANTHVLKGSSPGCKVLLKAMGKFRGGRLSFKKEAQKWRQGAFHLSNHSACFGHSCPPSHPPSRCPRWIWLLSPPWISLSLVKKKIFPCHHRAKMPSVGPAFSWQSTYPWACLPNTVCNQFWTTPRTLRTLE